MEVRTRFAPSPTGYLHIGALRTVLYCYAQAKHNNGKFVLRLEDTDRTRFVADAEEKIFQALKLYGLEPDESSVHGGDYGPYRQSERLSTYKEYAAKLIEAGYAFYCFLSQEETKQLQEEFMKENKRFRSPFRDSPLQEAEKRVKAGEKYTIRLKVPNDRTLIYKDGVQGQMRFHTDEVDDQVLIKQDGFPTYHLAVVVDDYLMKISHIFRGFEWVPSTPKQMLIHEGLGLEMPQYYHLSTILDPAGGKLSKRKGATFAVEFIKEGYLPGAVLNFIMLLGWSAPIKREHGQKEKEIFTLQEIVELFDPVDLNKTNAVFDSQKLIWFNRQYIKDSNSEELTDYFKTWISEYRPEESGSKEILEDDQLSEKIDLVKQRANTLAEIPSQLSFFYNTPSEVDWSIPQLENVKDKIEEIKTQILELHKSFSNNSTEWKHEEWEQGMRKIADEFGLKAGDVFMVLRVAVCGAPFSPPLFESLQILGKDEVVGRLGR